MLRGLFQVTNTSLSPLGEVHLLGDGSGIENLVAARGLELRRAGKGVVRLGVERLSLWN